MSPSSAWPSVSTCVCVCGEIHQSLNICRSMNNTRGWSKNKKSTYSTSFRFLWTTYIHSLSWLVMATGGSSPRNGKYSYGAMGTREVLLITSNPTTQDDDVVPRRPGGELTDDDRQRLEHQGVPRDSHHDDLSIMKARFSLDKDISIAEVLRDDGSLSCEQVTKKITQLLNNTDTSGGN